MKIAVLIALLAAVSAHAECRMGRAASLPITLWQQKLFVPVEVDGTRAFFFVDTGASTTTLSEQLADRLSLPRDFDRSADVVGVGGVESRLTIVRANEVSLQAVHIQKQSFPVAAFAESMADGSPVGGLIGADILSRFDLDLDLPDRRLVLWTVAGCSEVRPDWPGDAAGTPLQVAPSRHASIPVRIDGASLDLLIDTGAPTLILSSRAAARAGATPDVLEENRRMVGHGVNDRAFDARMHIFGRVEVAGQVFGDVRAIVVAPSRVPTGDGLLGLEFLKRARVWLSYGTSTLFVQKSND